MGAPVILITGALTGIGRATAFAFAKEGATVVASGRRGAEGNALEAELRSLGAEAEFIPAWTCVTRNPCATSSNGPLGASAG